MIIRILLGVLLYLFLGMGAYTSINAQHYLPAFAFLLGFLILNGFLGQKGLKWLSDMKHSATSIRKPNKTRSNGIRGWNGNLIQRGQEQTQQTPQQIQQTKPQQRHYTVRPQVERLSPKEAEKLKQEALAELEGLIGMDEVKEQVRRFLNHIDMEKEREKQGMATSTLHLHMLLLGNSGTGKTTVARIIGKFLKGAGVLPTGQLIETDREGLVEGFIGGTATKTKAKIEEAMGGILFIDEAYALNGGSERDFGHESLAVLIKAMEDFDGKFMVIFAGYGKEMKGFLEMNSGLESRIEYTFTLPDYDPYDLYRIALQFMNRKQMWLEEDTNKALYHLIAQQWMPNQGLKGNGRWARKLVEQVRIAQNNRIRETGSTDFNTVLLADIEEALRWVKG